jgi:signal transduction histidine kinase
MRATVRAGLAQALAFARSAATRQAISRRAIATDILLAAAVSAAALATAPAPASPLGPVLVALTAVPLAARRAFPITAFWVIIAAIIILGNDNTNVSMIAALFAAYCAVVYSRYRGLALLSLPLAGLILTAAFQNTAPPIPGRVIALVILLAIAGVGNAVRVWRARVGDSRARLLRMQAEHEATTQRALELERARIASELHDVVTHSVSVMVVQAGAARQVLTPGQDEARSALLAVEASGRTAMAELQHMLGLLSVPGEQEPGTLTDEARGRLQPLPGLGQLTALTHRMVAAGLDVELRILGAPWALPPGGDLAGYRVVQEALTNVLKHAGTARTVITLDYRPDGLVIDVADDGPPRPAAGPASAPQQPARPAAMPGSGRGLLGLRERVVLHGGEFDAGPRPGGGWRVTARFPAEEPPPPGLEASGMPATPRAASSPRPASLPKPAPS